MIQMVSNLVFYSPELDTHNGIKKMTLNGACKCNTSGKMSKKRGIKHILVHTIPYRFHGDPVSCLHTLYRRPTKAYWVYCMSTYTSEILCR